MAVVGELRANHLLHSQGNKELWRVLVVFNLVSVQGDPTGVCVGTETAGLHALTADLTHSLVPPMYRDGTHSDGLKISLAVPSLFQPPGAPPGSFRIPFRLTDYMHENIQCQQLAEGNREIWTNRILPILATAQPLARLNLLLAGAPALLAMTAIDDLLDAKQGAPAHGTLSYGNLAMLSHRLVGFSD